MNNYIKITNIPMIAVCNEKMSRVPSLPRLSTLTWGAS